ncbi:hypothetical protein HC766_07485 [Candidatus Gracilibacteria bacterium]|nr:hypothetical protein [Candidatus Gracilibacteria bacterium]
MGAALIAIGIGRRQPEFKPLVYLGLTGVSVAAFESLLYQMLQTSGGALGDGLIVMATLFTSLTYIYRILSPWLSNYLGLTNAELKIFAHLHWVLSSWLLVSAATSAIEFMFKFRINLIDKTNQEGFYFEMTYFGNFLQILINYRVSLNCTIFFSQGSLSVF